MSIDSSSDLKDVVTGAVIIVLVLVVVVTVVVIVVVLAVVVLGWWTWWLLKTIWTVGDKPAFRATGEHIYNGWTVHNGDSTKQIISNLNPDIICLCEWLFSFRWL